MSSLTQNTLMGVGHITLILRILAKMIHFAGAPTCMGESDVPWLNRTMTMNSDKIWDLHFFPFAVNCYVLVDP